MVRLMVSQATGHPVRISPAAFLNAPLNCGFSYSLDTAKYSNGRHTLNVRVTDTSGNVAVFPTVAVTVSN